MSVYRACVRVNGYDEWSVCLASRTTSTNSPPSNLDNFLYLLQLSRKRKMCKERTNCIWRSQWLQLVRQKLWMKFPTSNALTQASLISAHLDYSIAWIREQLFISPADSAAKLITEKEAWMTYSISTPFMLSPLFSTTSILLVIFLIHKKCAYMS